MEEEAAKLASEEEAEREARVASRTVKRQRRDEEANRRAQEQEELRGRTEARELQKWEAQWRRRREEQERLRREQERRNILKAYGDMIKKNKYKCNCGQPIHKMTCKIHDFNSDVQHPGFEFGLSRDVYHWHQEQTRPNPMASSSSSSTVAPRRAEKGCQTMKNIRPSRPSGFHPRGHKLKLYQRP
jgi:hypothetical protein